MKKINSNDLKVNKSIMRDLTPYELDQVAGADCGRWSTLTTSTSITTTTSPICTVTSTTTTTSTTTSDATGDDIAGQ